MRFNKDSQINNNSIRHHNFITRINHPRFLHHNHHNHLNKRLKYLRHDHRPKVEEKKPKPKEEKAS